MSQWMNQVGNRSKGPVEGYVSQPNFPAKHSAGNVYGRRSRMVNSDGAPSPYNPDAAQLAAVRLSFSSLFGINSLELDVPISNLNFNEF